MLPDHYQALGIHPLASREEIRAAYLRVMRAHHPDRRPGDAASEQAARRANAAWDVLGDQGRRQAYDRARVPVGPRPGQARQAVEPARRRAPAYSDEGRRYRRAFLVASLRVAAAILVVGTMLLALTGL